MKSPPHKIGLVCHTSALLNISNVLGKVLKELPELGMYRGMPVWEKRTEKGVMNINLSGVGYSYLQNE